MGASKNSHKTILIVVEVTRKISVEITSHALSTYRRRGGVSIGTLLLLNWSMWNSQGWHTLSHAAHSTRSKDRQGRLHWRAFCQKNHVIRMTRKARASDEYLDFSGYFREEASLLVKIRRKLKRQTLHCKNFILKLYTIHIPITYWIIICRKYYYCS